MSLGLPSDVRESVASERVDRVSFVQFPDPTNSATFYWTTWTTSVDVVDDDGTHTYDPRDMAVPQLSRSINDTITDTKLIIDNTDRKITDIANRNGGLYRRRVMIKTYSVDHTDDPDDISKEDWKINAIAWEREVATISITPELFLNGQKLTETASRTGCFQLAGKDIAKNFNEQSRTTPRTASSNRS